LSWGERFAPARGVPAIADDGQQGAASPALDLRHLRGISAAGVQCVIEEMGQGRERGAGWELQPLQMAAAGRDMPAVLIACAPGLCAQP
jgi:hypothetical protein